MAGAIIGGLLGLFSISGGAYLFSGKKCSFGSSRITNGPAVTLFQEVRVNNGQEFHTCQIVQGINNGMPGPTVIKLYQDTHSGNF